MKNIKLLMIFIDFILLNIAYFSAILIKRGDIDLSKDYSLLLFVFYGLWLFSIVLAKKFSSKKPQTFRQGIQPFLRAFFYFSFMLLSVHFFFQLFYYSRFIILASLLLFIGLELIVYGVFYLIKWGPNINIINGNEGLFNGRAINEQTEYEDIFIDKNRNVRESFKMKLQEILHSEYKDLFNFIDKNINLNAINASDSLMLDTEASGNVLGVMNRSFEFIGNICRVNNIRRVNRFFIAVNKKLISGGYFFGVVETLEQRLKRRYAMYPKYSRKLFYFLDFIWTRVFPKLPGLQKIYFSVHGEERRIISKPELLGRLFYCGFKLVKLEDINNDLYFIVKKVRQPLDDSNPSYGIVFKQKRIGLNGEFVYTYKLRTMYPYSEYLHKYLLGRKKISKTGKIEKDIRITGWGRIFRKYWIDELPMLLNLLQGDLKLVGLRPISQSFFNIYPEELKKERIKYKPGLIPSLYVDMFTSEEEIFEIERKYIEKYKKHPLRTDFVYFFKVWWNIIFKGVRSY